ncbi:hypothetical protein [Stutzerimonas stutzeri]|uniref:hypothetical protein n=1 Tax=Stutzerimonas stutzeri TaxID=316 RepID=UPI001CFDC3E5|nr:hypothetical protein [Stutzerimonas stutzeri]
MSEMSAEWPFPNDKHHAKNKKLFIYQKDKIRAVHNPAGRSDAQHRKLCKFLRSRGSKLRSAATTRGRPHCEQLINKVIHRSPAQVIAQVVTA